MTAIQTLEKKVRRLEDVIRRLTAADAIRPVLADPLAVPIGPGTVGTAYLTDGSVTTLKVANQAITGLKLANLAVDTAQLADAAITNAKIANATIQSAKIASLTADKLAAGTITVQLDFGVGGKAIFSGIHRLDSNGYQLRTQGAQVTAIIGVDELSDTPELNASYWKLSGGAEDGILANFVELGLYTSGTVRSRLFLDYGSFTQASLYAGTVLGFRASNLSGGTGVYLAPILNPTLGGHANTDKVIAAGAIDLDSSYWYNGDFHLQHPGYVFVDTEALAATDDLDNINGTGLRRGQLLVIQANDAARTVNLREGVGGNLVLAGNMALDNTEDKIGLIYTGSAWHELFRSNNGA